MVTRYVKVEFDHRTFQIINNVLTFVFTARSFYSRSSILYVDSRLFFLFIYYSLSLNPNVSIQGEDQTYLLAQPSLKKVSDLIPTL